MNDFPANTPSNDPSSHARLADDAMHRAYPERFSSREEWDAYNAMLTERERSLEYRTLHDDLD